MKLKPYPKYKDSGIKWIGKIPEGWEVHRLKFKETEIMGQSPDSESYNYEYKGYPFLQGNAEFSYVHPNPSIWCDAANKYALKNDILLSVRAPIGAINIADQKYGIGRGLCAIRVKTNNLKYIFYQLLTCVDYLNSIGTGSTYTAISTEDIINLPMRYPPLSDQTAIANFLDKKTAKIGKLIEKDKKLIALLKEKRTALINHCVTKGLDPNVKLKDSGIKWIGKIPEGWEVHKLKYKSYINNKKIGDNTNPNFKMNYLDISNVDSNGNVKKVEEQYFEDAPIRARRIPKRHDTIISTVRTYLKAIVYLDNIPENLIVSTGFAVIEPTKNISPKFLFYAIRSEKFIQKVIADSKGVAYPAINTPELGQIYLIIPPLPDQTAIANYLDKATIKIDKTIKLIEKKIALLEEYKKSLIHYVVTGKVDVRGVEV